MRRVMRLARARSKQCSNSVRKVWVSFLITSGNNTASFVRVRTLQDDPASTYFVYYFVACGSRVKTG